MTGHNYMFNLILSLYIMFIHCYIWIILLACMVLSILYILVIYLMIKERQQNIFLCLKLDAYEILEAAWNHIAFVSGRKATFVNGVIVKTASLVSN